MHKTRAMITTEDDDYVRISLLLLKGGGMVSEGILNREVHKSGKSIDQSLSLVKFEKKLKHQFHKKQKKVLYPTSKTTNIKEWDLQMLTGVLLTVFKKDLDGREKDAIQEIKSVRNEIYAHRSLEPLTHSEYEDERIKLVAALELLSSKLDDHIQQKCKDLIKECTESHLDRATVNKLLEGISVTEELSNEILNRLNQISKDLGQKIDEQHEKTRTENVDNRNFVVDEIRKILQDEERRKQKLFTVLDTELTLTGDKGQHEVIDEAEKIIIFVFNAAIKRAGSTEYPRVVTAVHEMLTEINSIPDVEVLPAEPKCILVKFRCKSYEGLLNLLLYLESEAYTKCLNKIVDAVCATLPLKKPIHLISKLNPESLKGIVNLIVPVESETLYSRTIKLPIKVTSLGGMAEVYNLFESGGATNSFNKVSDSIFSRLGAKITLKPSLNVEQVKKELKSARETETHYQSENKKECPDIENKDTNLLSTSVIVAKRADYVPSKNTGFKDFDSRKTLPSSRSPDTYEEEETDETYATPRKKMEKDKKGLKKNIEEIGETEKHDQDQDIEEHLFPSSDQKMADTNKIYTSILLAKSREYEPSIDSGFDEVASHKALSSSGQSEASKALSSPRQSVACKEENSQCAYVPEGVIKFEKNRENDVEKSKALSSSRQSVASKALSSSRQSVACKEENLTFRVGHILEDGKEILIGMPCGDLEQSIFSVGPFVSIKGMHFKCFITCGFNLGEEIDYIYMINNRRRNVKILADGRGKLLVAVDDAGSSGGKDVDPGSELLMQADKASLRIGTKVFKVGLSGYRQGIIYKLHENCKLMLENVNHLYEDILIVGSSYQDPTVSFADPGDSGAAVFCQIEDKVCCIGILIGKLSYNECCFVQRIENVLTDLQNVCSKQISLDMYEMNLQLSKYPHLQN